MIRFGINFDARYMAENDSATNLSVYLVVNHRTEDLLQWAWPEAIST